MTYYTYHTCMHVYTSYKVKKLLLWLLCFVSLPSVPHFSNAAGVGSTFEVFISAKVLLPILGN